MGYGMDAGELQSPADNYGKDSKFYTNIRRALKVLAYGLFFMLVLCTSVASKGSLLLMTQSLGNVKQVRNWYVNYLAAWKKQKIKKKFQERQYASRWSMLLTAIVCVPYLFTFMESIAHSLFRNRKGPSFTNIIVVSTLWHEVWFRFR